MDGVNRGQGPAPQVLAGPENSPALVGLGRVDWTATRDPRESIFCLCVPDVSVGFVLENLM